MSDSTEEKFISENIAIILGFIKKNNILVKICGSYDDAVSECMFCLSKYIHLYDKEKSKPSTFITMCLNTLLKNQLRKYYAKDRGYHNVSNTLSDFEKEENNYNLSQRMCYSISFDGTALYNKIYDEASEDFKLYLQGYSIRDIARMQPKKISAVGMRGRLKREAEKIRKKYRISSGDLK